MQYDHLTDETIAEIGADIDSYFENVEIKPGSHLKQVDRLNKAGRPFGMYGDAPRIRPCDRCGIDIVGEGNGQMYEFKNEGRIWCMDCFTDVYN